VSGQIDSKVGAVNFGLKQLFKLLVEMFIGPVLVGRVQMSCFTKSSACFFDPAVAEILHKKRKQASVYLAHAVVVLKTQA